jgi:hypothetical protein
VTKKFSLKDNPIFQRLAPPPPPEVLVSSDEDSASSAHRSEDQILTLTQGPSNIDPQALTLTNPVEQPPQSQKAPRAPAQPPPSSSGVDWDLRDHLDKSLFFSFYNEVADELLPTLDPAAQVLYSRLFRLSYGFNRNYCTVSQALLMERTGLSRNTVRTTLQSLVEEGWIKIMSAGNRISTSYRVILPREWEQYKEERGAPSDSQSLTVKQRPSKYDGQEMSLKNRGAMSASLEGQFSDPQNFTGNSEKSPNPMIHDGLQGRGADFDPHRLSPLLGSFTHRSLTVPEREADPQILTLTSLHLSARELVEKFYSLLRQRAPKAKREKNIQECLDLLQEGFTIDEVDYAISWLVTQHPKTGSFSRLAHFIDQALKERAMPQSLSSPHHPQMVQEEDREEKQRREEEEQQRKRIEEAKAALSSEGLANLYEEAQKLIRQENPNIRFGENILIQLKLDELIWERYLSETPSR